MVKVTKEMIIDNIYGSQETQWCLCVNRRRLNALVKSEKLKPIKSLGNEHLFFKSEVIALRKEMMKDTRTNLYKQSKGEIVND